MSSYAVSTLHRLTGAERGPACRYYGESKPYRKHMFDRLEYLTSEQVQASRVARLDVETSSADLALALLQAMADYAELITDLKAELGAKDSAVISFGGSYGGVAQVATVSFAKRLLSA